MNSFFHISRLGSVHYSSRFSLSLSRRWKIFRVFRLPYVGGYEQSIRAYEDAYQEGFRTLLVDVRKTKDSCFVCWHDDDVSPVARQKGHIIRNVWKISEHSFAELQDLVFCGTCFNRGGRILTIEEMLSYCQERGLMLEVEVKQWLDPASCLSLSTLIKKYGMEKRVIIHRNQGETDMLSAFGKYLPEAYLSRTGNGRSSMDAMIQLDVSNKKLLTITNYKRRVPQTLSPENCETLRKNNIGIIFSEVKKKKDVCLIKKIQPYLSFCASRFILNLKRV